MHFLSCILWLHVDSTFLADGDYQILPEPEVDISEAAGNITEELTEAPNPSSEEFINTSDPNPASEGKLRTYPIIFFTLQPMLIYLYLCIKSRSCNGTLDAYF
jgi:hypothetical protein